MHREERAVESDERQPEMNLGECIVHIASIHFREPEDNTTENSEQTSTEYDVVNMCHNVVGIVDKDVHRRICHVDTTESTDDKHRNESDTVKHRGCKSDGTSEHRSQPVKRFNSRRHRNEHGRRHEYGA